MQSHSFARQISCVALAMALCLGCNDSATAALDETAIELQLSPDGVPLRDASPIQTDTTVYQLVRNPGEYRAYVSATYRNATGGPVYFARCGSQSTTPIFGAGRTGPDSARTFFQDWAWACVGGVPTGTIANGESVTFRVPFGSGDQPNMNPPLRPEQLIGLMRVNLLLCRKAVADSDYCEMLSLRNRQSNAFLVKY